MVGEQGLYFRLQIVEGLGFWCKGYSSSMECVFRSGLQTRVLIAGLQLMPWVLGLHLAAIFVMSGLDQRDPLEHILHISDRRSARDGHPGLSDEKLNLGPAAFSMMSTVTRRH